MMMSNVVFCWLFFGIVSASSTLVKAGISCEDFFSKEGKTQKSNVLNFKTTPISHNTQSSEALNAAISVTPKKVASLEDTMAMKAKFNSILHSVTIDHLDYLETILSDVLDLVYQWGSHSPQVKNFLKELDLAQEVNLMYVFTLRLNQSAEYLSPQNLSEFNLRINNLKEQLMSAELQTDGKYILMLKFESQLQGKLNRVILKSIKSLPSEQDLQNKKELSEEKQEVINEVFEYSDPTLIVINEVNHGFYHKFLNKLFDINGLNQDLQVVMDLLEYYSNTLTNDSMLNPFEKQSLVNLTRFTNLLEQKIQNSAPDTLLKLGMNQEWVYQFSKKLNSIKNKIKNNFHFHELL